MRPRSPAAVIVLSAITLLVYHVWWLVQTKDEMNELGANIPSAWWLLVPVANAWWLWKWAQGCEIVGRARISAAFAFLLLLAGPIGAAVIQAVLNAAVAARVRV